MCWDYVIQFTYGTYSVLYGGLSFSQHRAAVPFIKKYLKTAVASGELVQTKGKGASGSFNLAAAKTEKPAVPAAPARGRASSARR